MSKPRGEKMRKQLGWDRPLHYRRGAETRLRGLRVFHDFAWSDHFPDRRVQFRGGQHLADQVLEDCPAGKDPALLLTDRGDVEEGARETNVDYVVVVNLPRYADSAADVNAAMAYMARRLGQGITRAKSFSEFRHEDLAAVLHEHLDAAALIAWASDNDERLEVLRRVSKAATTNDQDPSPPETDEVVTALQALETLEGPVIEAFAELVAAGDVKVRHQMLHALTQDSEGRSAAGETVRARTPERLGDARHAADEFDALLLVAGETKIQGFLEEHVWLLGLDYAQIRARQPIVRGAVDFLLERFDGFHDLLELKSPSDRIFDRMGKDKSDVLSPSAFRLSRPLALALAQVHAYRDILSEDGTHRRFFGLSNTREPRITILIGTSAGMSEQEQRLLRELNRSLHRVEVVPFDVVARRAHAVLDNVDRHLLAAAKETASRPDEDAGSASAVAPTARFRRPTKKTPPSSPKADRKST